MADGSVRDASRFETSRRSIIVFCRSLSLSGLILPVLVNSSLSTSIVSFASWICVACGAKIEGSTFVSSLPRASLTLLKTGLTAATSMLGVVASTLGVVVATGLRRAPKLKLMSRKSSAVSLTWAMADGSVRDGSRFVTSRRSSIVFWSSFTWTGSILPVLEYSSLMSSILSLAFWMPGANGSRLAGSTLVSSFSSASLTLLKTGPIAPALML